jgi:hypothetical protein
VAYAPPPYPDQLASLLQSPQIVVVVAVGEQGTGELDVVHGNTSPELSPGAEPGGTTSVENFSPGAPCCHQVGGGPVSALRLNYLDCAASANEVESE